MRQRTGLLCAAARLGLVAACSPGLSLARAGDSTQIFGRIQTVMRERLGRLPDYTCHMEVRRLWSTPRRSDWLPMDQWQLELTVIGGKEMYGRPGEHEMRYEDIARLIPNGTIGVGEFAVIAENLFFSDQATFQFKGLKRDQGRRVYRFDFVVPKEKSAYELAAGAFHVVVPYEGSFWADRESFELTRLEIRALDLPPELRAKDVRTGVEYAHVIIDGRAALLASTSTLAVSASDGVGCQRKRQKQP